MGYNFYMPLSLVDENMQRAQDNNAVACQIFWVNKNSLIRRRSVNTVSEPLVAQINKNDLVELSLNQFFNGCEIEINQTDEGKEVLSNTTFPGLIPSLIKYLDMLGVDNLTKGRLMPYLQLLQKRAAGTLPTCAQWIRKFVHDHPAYKSESERHKGTEKEKEDEDAVQSYEDRVGRKEAEASSFFSLPDVVVTDLLQLCDDIGMGRVQCPSLLG